MFIFFTNSSRISTFTRIERLDFCSTSSRTHRNSILSIENSFITRTRRSDILEPLHFLLKYRRKEKKSSDNITFEQPTAFVRISVKVSIFSRYAQKRFNYAMLRNGAAVVRLSAYRPVRCRHRHFYSRAKEGRIQNVYTRRTRVLTTWSERKKRRAYWYCVAHIVFTGILMVHKCKLGNRFDAPHCIALFPL